MYGVKNSRCSFTVVLHSVFLCGRLQNALIFRAGSSMFPQPWSALYHNQEYNDYLHSEDFLDAMYRVTIEDGLNKNSRSHLSLADAPIFKDAEAVMALPEVATAYTTDLKKLTFDKSKMP